MFLSSYSTKVKLVFAAAIIILIGASVFYVKSAFSVQPMFGSAPLSVHFQVTSNDQVSVHVGQGTGALLLSSAKRPECVGQQCQVASGTYTYQTPGIYFVQFWKNTSPCENTPRSEVCEGTGSDKLVGLSLVVVW